jgi:hypothetical protein
MTPKSQPRPAVLFALLSLLLTPLLAAQQGYVRILVPVAFSGEVPGAFGSRWKVELQGRTFYPNPVEVTRAPFLSAPKVSGPFTFTDLPTASGPIFLYVHEGDMVSLNLRVRDLSREGQNWGTEIPLVTEEQTFTSAPIQLSGIPLDPRVRQTLRVYDYDGLNAATFNVRLIPRDAPQTVVEKAYAMTQKRTETFPDHPGYAEISLAELVPPGATGLADVVITHPYSGPRLWAFVSITNNDTQFITTVTPAFNGRGTVVFIP